MMVWNVPLFHNCTINVYWTPTTEMFKMIFNVTSFILLISIIRKNEKSLLWFSFEPVGNIYTNLDTIFFAFLFRHKINSIK